jgi:DNA-binding MarR family transcriptional regulator
MNQSMFAIVRTFERFRGAFAREHGLSVTEIRAMSRLARQHPMTPKQLAASLELTTGAVTSLTDRLVEAGLITRSPHPTDRRSLLLDPSDKGLQVIASVDASFEELLRRSTEGLDDERLAQFDELLSLLVAQGDEIPTP